MSVFLSARWEHLVLLNYVVPRELLEPLVPAGTELDDWQGRDYVSLVAFRFVDTRVRGWAIPGHRDFEEVNLRFYVRRRADGGGRDARTIAAARDETRGVVFIRELVPRRAIAGVARSRYNEPYLAVPMSHRVDVDAGRGGALRYDWAFGGVRFCVEARVSGPAQPLRSGSEDEFILEHYRGYTRQRDGGTIEYVVEHPRWHVWTPDEVRFSGDAAALYGPRFAAILAGPPASSVVALGSPVTVHRGVRIA
jgi:uncharacterized protein YqjF (DUF2071 family)